MNFDPFKIVKDSSIWQSNSTADAINRKDPYIRIGIVRRAFVESRTSDIVYLVDMQDRGDGIPVRARFARSFGGAFNYEDVIYRGYKYDDKPDPTSSFEAKAGDHVIVAFLNGNPREAIILGALPHSARKIKLDIKKGPQFISEFNGVETSINNDGEYKLTFKAVPTNLNKLEAQPKGTLPAPVYDEKIGGSFFQFDKTGSIEINDKDKEFQNLRIDKKEGTITINSGNIKLTMTKKEEKVELKCKVLNVTADNIAVKTKEYSLDAATSVKVKSSKVAIGKEGVELLDQIFQLIEMLGKVTPISPVGPCTPLISTPQWSGVVSVQSKVKEITGSL